MELRVIVLAVAVVLPFVYYLLQTGKRSKGIPPGPPTLPIVGNLHQIPGNHGFRQFKKWADEYGPIYSLILGTKTFIVLNTDTAVKDLLDKRSNIYSSRPDLYMAHDVASGGLRMVTMASQALHLQGEAHSNTVQPYGPLWRSMHKAVHNILNIRAAASYVPYQDLENKLMLIDFLDKPDDYDINLKRYTHSLTTQIIFGFRTLSAEDEKFKRLFEGFEKWTAIVGSASAQILDVYPILRKLPEFLRPNYRYAKKLHEKELELYRGHWVEAKQRVLEGTSMPCFSHDLLKAQKIEGLNDDQAGYIAGSLLEAGADTTSAILVGFLLAMVVFDKVQATAQEELDRVIGPDRLPLMDDAPNLPYIQACVKETLRWMPTTVLAAPHGVIRDDEYMGYRIPAGASVIPNAWGIHMDSNRNPNPREFDPTRFKDNLVTEFQSAQTNEPGKRNNFGFGAGRRLCQGMHIAERSIFLAISRILWGFKISKPLDASGQPITPDIEDLRGGAAVMPAPFKMVMKPRSQAREKLMRKEWTDAKAKFLTPDTLQWKEAPQGMAFNTYVPEAVDV